jgi:hypothetical protein
MKDHKNFTVVKKAAPQIVLTAIIAGGIWCEVVSPGLEPNPHVEQEVYEQGCTVRAQASLSGNVVARESRHSNDAVVATQGALAHSIDAFIVRLEK